jgi:competence protein ComEC
VWRAPLLFPAFGFLSGILAEQHGLCLVAFGAAFLTAFAWLPLSVGLAAGAAVSIVRGHPPSIEDERRTARHTATVVGDVRALPDGRRSTTLAIAGVGTVRTTVATALGPGDRVAVRGRLEPFDLPRNPGEPSLRALERAEGIAGRLAGAHVLSRAPPDPRDARTWPARLRASLSRTLRARIAEPSATILAGALWGERGTLPDDLHDAFQATGTVHVLVTAGLHLGVFAGLVVALMRPFALHRALACAIAIVLVAAYAWLSGAHLPAQRAAVMIAAALGARACGARIVSWNAFALAAIAVAAIWPAAVEGASFALSFSCVAAIVAFAEPVTNVLHRITFPERVREAVALTIAAQIGTWPLTAAIFSTLAPYAILANAIVVPLIVVALPGGLATLVFAPLAGLEILVLRAIEGTVRLVAGFPGARATIGTPPLWSILGYDALALGAAALLRRARPALALITLVAGSLLVLTSATLRLPHGLEIIFLDVGQGDGAVIRTPHDRIVLIDAGGELERGNGTVSSAEEAGARTVLAYLRRAGIAHIDLLLLTHPHGDHVGACRPILDAMPVGVILDSGQSYSGRAYRDCIASAHAHRVPIVVARRGMRWSSSDGVTLDVLAPEMPFLADTGDDVNENSIVVMLGYRGFRELFMGDAGEASEARLLAAGDDLNADAVKVGHHGSRYASTPPFVAAVHPRIAVISVGRHNTFGHPASATVKAWQVGGADVLRTDQCGAISLLDRSPVTVLRCAMH